MSVLTASARGEARSRAYQLFALVFTHPESALHVLLVDGSYRRALTDSIVGLYGQAEPFAEPPAAFVDYESDYIGLFATGRGGHPVVPLNAGEYERLRLGRSRAEQMLEYLRCYRHFGLQLDTEAGANELPDHLSCQLEFMAWLAYLEAGARTTELEAGYQRAQRDFATRLTLPLLGEMEGRLESMRDAPAFFADVLRFLASVVAETIEELSGLDEPAGDVSVPRAGKMATEIASWE
ncbi:MAG TPA: molecular chaperone TorD family protein [Gammaproteobacteria bacterium]|jgi:DMSO reductase family type II enzyme chaperone|nr:molecular chaperone TorD family protein [Gammaproteobacteria bacterium]